MFEAYALQTSTTGTLDEVVFGRIDLWWVLLVVPVVMLCFVWAARQRRRALATLGDAWLVRRLVATVDPNRRAIAAAAVVLAAAGSAFGLMRPQYGGTAEIVPASGLDIVLAVDYSKSMLARDVYPSRNERLEAELTHFLEEADRRGDRVGLVVFAGAARGLPITRDARLLEMYLDRADPRLENPGGTAIGKALKLGLAFLVDARASDRRAEDETSEAAQIIVLLTDGEDNASRPLEVAGEAARLGVRIYTVGIGSRSGEPIQQFDEDGEPAGYVTDDEGNYVMTRLGEGMLQDIARTTGGEYVHIESDRFGLDRVRELVADLSASEREDTIEIHRREGYRFVVLPALVLLCISLAVGDRRRRPA